MPDDITPNGLPEGGIPADAVGTVSEETASLDLSELNKLINKNFPTKEAALKSIRDTFGYVGKMGELKGENELLKSQIDTLTGQKPQDTSDVRALKDKVDEMTFLQENANMKDYLPTLRKLRQETGKSLSELAADEALKPLFTKALEHDETLKKRNVLDSNPRLGQVTDKMDRAKELMKDGNVEAAKQAAVSAVLETL